jgi:hypothetical protein
MLVAVNLQNPGPVYGVLGHMQSQQQLLYADSSVTDNVTSTSTSSSSSSVQLVEHLLTTAIIRGHWIVLQTLVATPAAQRLGLQAVTQLLTLSIQVEPLGALSQVSMQPQSEDMAAGEDDVGNGNEGADQWYAAADNHSNDRVIGCYCFSSLCALPAAQSISASTIASLLRLAVEQKLYMWGHKLCELPGAQHMPLQQLFELLQQLLLPQSLRQGRDTSRGCLTTALLGLPAAREMPSGAAMQFISTLIHTNCSNGSWWRNTEVAMLLEAVGSYLTRDEMQQLQQQTVQLGCMDAGFALLLCGGGTGVLGLVNEYI